MLDKNVLDCFNGRMKKILSKNDWQNINEIRIRTGKPLILKSGAEEFFADKNGMLTDSILKAFLPEREDIEGIMNMLSDYSLYAVREQLKNGFITVRGGHRAAVAGSAVVENGELVTLKNISSVSVRIASERKGCAEKICKKLFSEKLKNVLVVSPVCGGKTTMLRDMLRILSDGGSTVGIADERGEIAACYMGVPQLDVGKRTDVLDCCPKAKGLEMLIRTMSPDIVSADEIGGNEDIKCIWKAVYSGVNVICTAHGSDMNDINERLSELKDVFDIYIFLEGRACPGKVKYIVGKRGENICL